jgi:hypothetical protein
MPSPLGPSPLNSNFVLLCYGFYILQVVAFGDHNLVDFTGQEKVMHALQQHQGQDLLIHLKMVRAFGGQRPSVEMW